MNNSIITNHWQIAWRKKGDVKFRLIPNPKWGWCADPFLVEFHDTVYLFAEIFLYRSERNGVIGYCTFDGDSWSEWTVTMDRHWHLSYPNVWTENGKLLMCPESYQAREVAVYELVSFPDQWKKAETLISDVLYCDTTFLDVDGQRYVFTYQRGETGASAGKGLFYKLNDSCLTNGKVFSESREGNRCGGKIIFEDKRLIRVAQNCSESYGQGLIFYEIDAVEPEYKEHEIQRIDPDDIVTETNKKYQGIHTYNSCQNIEVIDLKHQRFSLQEYFARRRVGKVFLNKYC